MDLLEIIDGFGDDPERIAHIYREGTLSYSELRQRSDALASYLIATYGDDRSPVIVYGHKQHEMLISFLGCVKAGHAYIPVDSSLPYERVREIVDNSAAQVIIDIEHLDWNASNIRNAGNSLKDGSNQKDGMPSIIDSAMLDNLLLRCRGCMPGKEHRVGSDDNFYIIYTSGSTGKPKGVQITLSCLVSFIGWGLQLCGSTAEQGRPEASLPAAAHARRVPSGWAVFLNQAPFSFDLSVMDLYLALASGSALYSIDKDMIGNLRELFDHLKRSGIRIWVSTPSFAELCTADSSFRRELLPELRLLLFCGETLPNECVEKLLVRFADVRIVNTYGPTEATVAVTAIDIDREICAKIKPLPLGYVKPDCRILIVDEQGAPVPDGVRGEILIAGDSVSPGYYRNAEKTGKAFLKLEVDGIVKRCYRTGDFGYLQNGLLYFGGRIDSQIKLSGYRIEIEDIENNLKKIAIISNAVVIPVVEQDRVKYLTAVVLLSRQIPERPFKIGLLIKEKLRELLPEYMIPRKIVIRESLPMTVNGKIDRKKLAESLR